MNPPTAMSFVRSMIDLVPDRLMHSSQKETVMDIAKFQIEMIVNEYDFCTCSASSIAFACILNGLESVVDNTMLCKNFETTVGRTIMVEDSCMRDLRIAIYELMDGRDEINNIQIKRMSNSTKMASSCAGNVATKGNNIHSSPRTVATSVTQRC
jgi:hypothetical protein